MHCHVACADVVCADGSIVVCSEGGLLQIRHEQNNVWAMQFDDYHFTGLGALHLTSPYV